MLGDTEDFLESVLPRLTEADTALHNGDVAPRIAIWSHNDPVTVFGAALMGSGWTEMSVGGAAPDAYELRVTEVFRRENGE